MILVVDASAAFKLVVEEAGSDVVRRLWDEDEVAWTAPALVAPEVASAITAAAATGRLPVAQAEQAHEVWSQLLRELDVHWVDEGLANGAARVARRAVVRGADAVYLGLVERFAVHADVALLSFDRRQREAAARAVEDVLLIPDELPAA